MPSWKTDLRSGWPASGSSRKARTTTAANCGLRSAVALLEQNIEHRETAGSHNERGLPYAPDHQPIEDRFGRSARRAAKFVAFWTFTGKGNVLNVVGYKIEPEQLHGKGIGKPRGIASRKSSNSAAPATSA
jgi:hypothetical protein